MSATNENTHAGCRSPVYDNDDMQTTQESHIQQPVDTCNGNGTLHSISDTMNDADVKPQREHNESQIAVVHTDIQLHEDNTNNIQVNVTVTQQDVYNTVSTNADNNTDITNNSNNNNSNNSNKSESQMSMSSTITDSQSTHDINEPIHHSTESQTLHNTLYTLFDTKTTKNAFDILSQSNKRKSTTPNTRANKRLSTTPLSQDGSRYVPCPLCGKEFAYFEIDAHAANCTGSTSNTTPSHNNNIYKTPHNKSTSKHNKTHSSKSKPTSSTGSSFENCVICNKPIAKALLSMHVNECIIKSASTTINSPSQSPEPMKSVDSNESQLSHKPSTESQMFHVHETPQTSNTQNVESQDRSEPIPIAEMSTSPPTSPKHDTDTNNKENNDHTNDNNTPVHPLFTAGALTGAAFKQQQRQRNKPKPTQTLLFLLDCDSTLSNDIHTITTNELQNVIVYNRSYGIKWYFIQSNTQHTYTDTLNTTVNNDSAEIVTDDIVNEYTKQYTQCGTMDLKSDQSITQLIIYASTSISSSPILDISTENSNLQVNQHTGKKWHLSPSQFKSMLQKNIRLSRPISAVRVALQLYQQHNFTELIRRIVICCIEDSILHPMLPYLVWCTVYCMKQDKDKNNVKLSYIHVNTVLQCVYEIAATTYKDNIFDTDITENDRLSLNDDLGDLSIPQQCLIRSLLIRTYCGGMTHDVTMLHRYAKLWLERFRHDNQKFAGIELNDKLARQCWLNLINVVYNRARVDKANAIVLIQIQDITYIEQSDLVLTGIDQHCSDLIKQLVNGRYKAKDIILKWLPDNLPSELCNDSTIGTMIWHNRSSITNKQNLRKEPDKKIDPIQNKLTELYKLIKSDIDKICERIIASRMQW